MILTIIESESHFNVVENAVPTGNTAILRVKCKTSMLGEWVRVVFKLPVSYGKNTWELSTNQLEAKGKKSLGTDELQYVEIFDFLTTFSHETTDVVFIEKSL